MKSLNSIWVVCLIMLGAASGAPADVHLSSSQGRYQPLTCSPLERGEFVLGDTVSGSCIDSHGGESASTSVQASSTVVNGAHGVESVSMSAVINAQGTFEGAGGWLELIGWFDVTEPTPYVLSVQPSFGGQVRGLVVLDAFPGGCECIGTDCALGLGCEGNGSLVLSGELPRGTFSFRAYLQINLKQEHDTEFGTAQLSASIQFGRTSQTYTWINPNGGDFAVDTNWNPQGVPTHDAQVSDTAVFTPGLYGVNIVGAKAGRFVVRQADVELIGDAQVFASTQSPASLEIEGDASLQLKSGSVLRGVHGVVGLGAAANANDFSAILLDDAATQLVLSGDLSVGDAMRGLVAVDGGFLEAATLRLGGAARGELEVTGADADALFVDGVVGGATGLGILKVLSGGAVTATDIRIGENLIHDAQTNETNTVKVAGAGSGGSPSHLAVTDDLLVGDNGLADLFVLDGALVEVGGSLTAGISGSGEVTVSSQDLTRPATLRIATELQIGEDHDGRFSVLPGGLVEAAKVRLNLGSLLGSGELTIDGQGQSNAARMKVNQELGVGGNPQLTPVFVKNGGVLTARLATIGNDALLTDEATVVVGTFGGGDTTPAEFNIVDPNSAKLTGGLVTIVGGAGPGRLNIAGGAIARLTGALRIGFQADGVMSVDNSGSAAGLRSTAILSDIATLGWSGAGDLAISNGGLVTSDSDVLVAFTSFGELRVFNGPGFTGDRAELRMLGSALEIGSLGSGELKVQGNGLVGCARLVVGGYDFAAAGDVLVDTGGEIHCLADMLVGAVNVGAGSVTVGPAGTLVVDGVLTVGGTSEGQIALTDATARVSAGIISGASTLVNNHGSIVGVGTLATTHLVIAPGGLVSPGLSPGTLTIDGDYEQQDGATLIIEVAGLEPGQFDVLKVTGSATLAGKLQLKFIDGYVPLLGDAIDCLQVNGATTGQLTVETLDADGQAAGIAATAEITAEGVRLTVGDDPAGSPQPDGCGAGLCGAGAVSMLPITFIGWGVMRPLRLRWRRS